MRIKHMFIIFILSQVLISCKDNCGTVTGNPMSCLNNRDPQSAMPGDNAQIEVPPIFSIALMKVVCEKLTSCIPGVVYDSCKSNFLNLSNIDEEIGLLKGQFSNFETIIEAETEGGVEPVSHKSALCLLEVKGLSCENPYMSGAYNEALDNPFEGVAALISTDDIENCEQVFQSQ